MAFTIVVAAVKLRSEPRDDSPNPAGIILPSDTVEKITDAGVPGWWKVRVATPGAAPREGFVLAELLMEASAPPAEPVIDKEVFFNQVTFAARAFGANRDYLYAVAVTESRIKNIRSASSGAFGPFQFMPATWSGLVARHGATTGVTEADFTNPGAQAIFAAISTADSQQALTRVLQRTPTAAQLYMAHFLGLPAASAVLAAAPGQAIDVPLRVFYKGTQLGAGFVEKILQANAGLLVDGGRIRTTAEVLDKMASNLGAGLTEAAKLGKKFGPPVSDMPGDPGEEPPWLVVARKELAKPVVEDKTEGASNPEIEKYFKDTTFGPARDDVPWCAAFVSWCMANAGNDRVAASNLRTAWAPSWINWGFSVGRPAIGAVAVLAGHVGFVVGEKTTTIDLLGGNQNKNGNDAVCIVQVPKGSIVGYRWLDWK